MRFFFAALCFFAALPSMGVAQLRIKTDKDTLDYTIVKYGFYRDASVRLTNISLTTVNVNLAKIINKNSVTNEFQIVVPQPPVFHIDSGDGRTIIIRFTPSGPGLRTAELDLLTDDGDKLIELIGIGATIQPDILMKPLSIDFGMLAPGEFKDTMLFVIGNGLDSATINWIGVNNDNGEVDFDVTPVDATVKFPLILQNGDTLKLNARFTAINASGPRTGRAVMQGEVSGETICEFRGAVGVPDMEFTPQLLDLGTVPQGTSVDTFISIASIGQSPVSLRGLNQPNIPFSISTMPFFPYSVKAGDTLKIPVHFDATAPGNFEEALLAFSKNGSETALNRTALLKAFVIPRVLSKISPQPFVVSCAIDSSYQRMVTITDTGSFPIPITSVSCADSGFTLQYPVAIPDTMISGARRDILVTFNARSGAFAADTFCIVNIISGSRVVISDTIHITATPENALFAVLPISSASASNPNKIGVVSVSDIARYKLSSLDLDFSVNPADVAEIDTLNLKLDKSIFPNATVTAGYDNIVKKYFAHITSSTILPSSPAIPFLQVPLKYFVAKDSSAIVTVSMHSPEKDGCLNFTDNSESITASNGCGDQEIRNLLGNTPLLSAVTISPNPVSGNHMMISFTNAEDISLTSQLLDLNGKIALDCGTISFRKGRNTLAVELLRIPSGNYSVHMAAQASDGHSQNETGSIILLH